MLVGATSLKPGEATFLMLEPVMHEGMGGQHLFEITVQTDSPTRPVHRLRYRAFFGD